MEDKIYPKIKIDSIDNTDINEINLSDENLNIPNIGPNLNYLKYSDNNINIIEEHI